MTVIVSDAKPCIFGAYVSADNVAAHVGHNQMLETILETFVEKSVLSLFQGSPIVAEMWFCAQVAILLWM